MNNVPKNLWYSKTHEWAMFTCDTIRLGLTDYAQNAMGDIVYADLPAVGDQVEAGGLCGEVESVKAVSEVHTPVGGTVCAVNSALADAPEMINKAPYEAWIAEIGQITEKGELLSPEQYEAFCEEEDMR